MRALLLLGLALPAFAGGLSGDPVARAGAALGARLGELGNLPSNLLPGPLAAYRETTGRPCYAIDARLDRDGLRGRVVVRHTNRRDVAVRTLAFELFPTRSRSRKTPRRVLRVIAAHAADPSAHADVASGAALPIARPTPGRVEVRLRAPLPPGRTACVQLTFTGQLPSWPAAGEWMPTLPFGRHGARVYLTAWHPVLALPTADGWVAPPPDRGRGDLYRAEIADWHVRLDLPADWTLATPGVVLHDRPGRRRRRLVLRGEGLRDWTLIGGPGYRLHSEGRLDVFAHRHIAAFGPRMLRATTRAFERLEALLGPYPYRRFRLVTAPQQRGFVGMEHSTLATLNDVPLPARMEAVISHEVAHQWWYLLVGTDQPSHPFLDESLTVACQLLADGELSERAKLRRVPGMLRGIGALDRDSLSAAIYRGGARWHLDLREALGARAYRAAIRRYLARHRWGIATPADLRRAFGDDVPPAARRLLAELR